jgi:IgGFc binding protein
MNSERSARSVLAAVFALTATAVPFACKATVGTGTGTFTGGAGGTGDTGPGSGGSTGTFTGQGGSGGDPILTAAGGGNSCGYHCSADLHSILDCNEQVVMACPADLGCGANGDCVPACESAKANASTVGCEFYSVVPGPEYETRGSCFAALLANTWTKPIAITADYGGKPLDVSSLARTPVGSGNNIQYQPLPGGMLAPGQIAILFLSQGPGGDIFFVPCPGGTTPGINTDPAVDKTGLGNAFHINTSAPVVAYDIYPWGGASSFVSSATLLVPTPAWGTNYIASDAYQADPNLNFVNGNPFLQIVASQDGTNVTISPTAAIEGGAGVQPTGQGQPVTYTMNKGQVMQFLQPAELSGSPISSDKPISVWGGTACMNIPVGTGACDSGHQQLLPIKALGHEYLAVRYRDRTPGANESVPWTLIGTVDGTQLTYDPSPPPAGAPLGLTSGQAVTFSASDAFSVKSQDENHPFYISGHMTGALAVPNNNNDDGDPEYVNVVPPQQYLPQYLFLTDPTYKNTHLVFTRKKAADGTFKDVKLDCAGTLAGWQPIGNAGNFQYTRLDLVAAGAPMNGCDNGAHTATSAVPFGLTVWGWDTTVSYAYPAGMSVQPINTVVVPPTPK